MVIHNCITILNEITNIENKIAKAERLAKEQGIVFDSEDILRRIIATITDN